MASNAIVQKVILSNGDHMKALENLIEVESHFKFGENWSSFARMLSDDRIKAAIESMDRLVPAEALKGKTFLDIGSGSGVHSLAAIRLGAAKVVAVDIDADSVRTTQEVIKQYVIDANFQCLQSSVFELEAKGLGKFDIVYSWGVLHHTGDMYGAIRAAAKMVKPGGLLVIALYRKTPFCSAWTYEKRWYKDASPRSQAIARKIYATAFRIGLVAKGQLNWRKFLAGYKQRRGMELYHDIHDWMGGYPYESIFPKDAEELMVKLGFKLERSFVKNQSFASSIFGSGCDEFVFVANEKN